MQIFTNANFNFLRWRWHAIILSLVVIAAGGFVMATRGIPLGIDFSGGAAFIIQVGDTVVHKPADVDHALKATKSDAVLMQIARHGAKIFVGVRLT